MRQHVLSGRIVIRKIVWLNFWFVSQSSRAGLSDNGLTYRYSYPSSAESWIYENIHTSKF